MEERITNYTISEGTELPSKGLIYSTDINPNIELRSMTARDEMKRLGPSSNPLKKLADIIEGCMIEKPTIHVYDMCLGDYEYLLHKLRIISYGSDYPMTIRCPFCGNIEEITMDLDALKIKDFNLEEFNKLKTFKLPKSGHTISLYYETPRMLDTIENKTKELRSKSKDSAIDFETLVKISVSIESIDGTEVNPVGLESFIYNLPALDMQKILNNIEKLNSMIGIDTSFNVKCKECDNDVLSFFRFGTEFFRPSNI